MMTNQNRDTLALSSSAPIGTPWYCRGPAGFAPEQYTVPPAGALLGRHAEWQGTTDADKEQEG